MKGPAMKTYLTPILLFVVGTIFGGPGLGLLFLLIWIIVKVSK